MSCPTAAQREWRVRNQEQAAAILARAKALHREYVSRGVVYLYCATPTCTAVWENHEYPVGHTFTCHGCGQILTPKEARQ